MREGMQLSAMTLRLYGHFGWAARPGVRDGQLEMAWRRRARFAIRKPVR